MDRSPNGTPREPRHAYFIGLGRWVTADGRTLNGLYSGQDDLNPQSGRPYRNDPRATHMAAKGPLPAGYYTIGPAHTSPHTGPLTMDLEPFPENAMFGRSLFRLHGDNAEHDASDGCIIAMRPYRILIDASPVRLLWVRPE